MYKYYNFIICINIIIILILILILTYNSNTNKIYIKSSKYGGRGVFANTNFNAGDIIEQGYSIISGELKCGKYIDYIYSRTDTTGVALLLGNGSLYNHSYNNNAYIKTIDDKFIVYAKTKINRGDEIQTCYGCNHPNNNNHYDYGESHKINLI